MPSVQVIILQLLGFILLPYGEVFAFSDEVLYRLAADCGVWAEGQSKIFCSPDRWQALGVTGVFGLCITFVVYSLALFFVIRKMDFLYYGMLTFGAINLLMVEEGFYIGSWFGEKFVLSLSWLMLAGGVVGFGSIYFKSIASEESEIDLRWAHLISWALFMGGALVLGVSRIGSGLVSSTVGSYCYLGGVAGCSTLLVMAMVARFDRFNRERTQLNSQLSVHDEESRLLSELSRNLDGFDGRIPGEFVYRGSPELVGASWVAGSYNQKMSKIFIIWMNVYADPLVSILLRGAMAGTFRSRSLEGLEEKGLQYVLNHMGAFGADMIQNDRGTRFNISGIEIDTESMKLSGFFEDGALRIKSERGARPVFPGESVNMDLDQVVTIKLGSGEIIDFVSKLGKTKKNDKEGTDHDQVPS